ncbi:hypothetical protein MBLNU13_g05847t1 [Cladosporium sp. NU13]
MPGLRHFIMLVLFWFVFLLVVSSADVPARRNKRIPKNGDTPSTHDDVDDYLQGVCAESDTWSTPTRPCEIMYTIDYQCSTGFDFDVDVDIMHQADPDCQGIFLDSAMGCYACYLWHGGAASTWLTVFDWQGITPIMDDYCDPMQDPTAGLHAYLEPLATSSDYLSNTRFSDPLGFSKTEVSLYLEQPSMTGVEAWSTTLSTMEEWSKDRIESLLSEESAPITPASDDDSRGSTFSNTITPHSTTSGTPKKVSKPSDSTSAAVVYPPIVIQPASPTSTTKPLPPASLVTKTGASNNITRIGCGGVFGILSLVAVLSML